MVGVILSGQLLDLIGRRHTLGIGAVMTAAGIGIQVGSHDWKVFLAGRLVNGTLEGFLVEYVAYPICLAIGFGMVFLVAPVWIGETVRPELRGFFLCITNGSIVLGQFILA